MIIVLLGIGVILTIIGTLNIIFSVNDGSGPFFTTIGLSLVIVSILIMKEKVKSEKFNNYERKKSAYETLFACIHDTIKHIELKETPDTNTFFLNIKNAKNFANIKNSQLLNNFSDFMKIYINSDSIDEIKKQASQLEFQLKEELEIDYNDYLRS